MLQKKWLKYLWLLVIVYALLGIVFYSIQDYIIFQPKALPANHAFTFKQTFIETYIQLDDATKLNIVQFKPARKDSSKGVVLYFHGNKKNIERFAPFAPLFTKHHYEVWIIDYPTYGKSTGALTEENLYESAYQLYKLANTVYNADSIIILGKSLGSGIATQLASKVNCKLLVLETPYYGLKELANWYAPIYPKNICKYNLNTYTYLPSIVAPIVVFHGTNDWVIPYSHAKQIKPLLRQKDKFYTIEQASHNGIFAYNKALQALDSCLQY